MTGGPAIWDGRGDADGSICFTKDSGEIVGRPYVVEPVRSALGKWRRLYDLEARRAAMERTVLDDGWLRRRAGNTVGSIVRDVEDAL